MFFRKMAAFIKRDFLIAKSYRLMFILNWGGIITTTLTFYFISKLFNKTINPYIAEYGTGYFPFVIIGIAFSTYFYTALNSFSNSIRIEQMTGTLEMLLLTPTRIRELITGMSLWDLVFASSRVFGYLLIGVFFLGLDVHKINILASIVVLIFTIICFSSIGIIAASVIMLFKKGAPISWFVSTFSSLFGGAYFPIEILPAPLRFISYLLPITYSLRSLRYTILKGYSLWDTKGDLLVLVVYSAMLVPISIFIFKMALKRVKVKGSLSHY
ncbi:MAG: ABC transporter permease [Candidatus Omnitrophica bacterium]|nr:ABC transporter permease [Candidatus Omnitrophota bacterium]